MTDWRVYLKCRDAFERSYDEAVRRAIDRSHALWDRYMEPYYGIDAWIAARDENSMPWSIQHKETV